MVLSIVLTPLRGVWCSVTCGIEVWGVVSAPSLLCHLLSKTKLSYRFFSLRVGFLLLHLPLVLLEIKIKAMILNGPHVSGKDTKGGLIDECAVLV